MCRRTEEKVWPTLLRHAWGYRGHILDLTPRAPTSNLVPFHYLRILGSISSGATSWSFLQTDPFYSGTELLMCLWTTCCYILNRTVSYFLSFGSERERTLNIVRFVRYFIFNKLLSWLCWWSLLGFLVLLVAQYSFQSKFIA